MADNPEERKEEQKAAPAKKEVAQMKAGDYTLHLLLQKAKDIAVADENAINVVIEVEVQDKKESSAEKGNVTSSSVVDFNSHVFFELMGQTVAKLEQTKIVVRLLEKGYFKNSLIGMFEMDLSFLYNLDAHTAEHRWVALINPESEDFSAIASYLKLSANVYGVDDEPKELKMDENPDSDDCLMPAALKPKYEQLRMYIIRGEHLPRLDVAMVGAGSMDAYIKCKFNGKKL